jgi:hypothetical protein
MQNQHRNQKIFPLKMPVPAMGKEAFSMWKHQHEFLKDSPQEQVAQENYQSGHTSLQSLDSAIWLVSNRKLQGWQNGSSQ